MKDVKKIDALSTDDGQYLVDLSQIKPSLIVKKVKIYLTNEPRQPDNEEQAVIKRNIKRESIIDNMSGIENILDSQAIEENKDENTESRFLCWSAVNLMLFELAQCYLGLFNEDIDSNKQILGQIASVIECLMKPIEGNGRITNLNNYKQYLQIDKTGKQNKNPLAIAISDSLKETCSTLGEYYYQSHIKKKARKFNISLYSKDKNSPIKKTKKSPITSNGIVMDKLFMRSFR